MYVFMPLYTHIHTCTYKCTYRYQFQHINIWCFGGHISLLEWQTWCLWHWDSVFVTWGRKLCNLDVLTAIFIAKLWGIEFIFYEYTLLKEVPFVFFVEKNMLKKVCQCQWWRWWQISVMVCLFWYSGGRGLFSMEYIHHFPAVRSPT